MNLINNSLNDTSKIMGFHRGQTVKINRHFFANHNMKYIDLGVGVIVAKNLPHDRQLPSLTVRFASHPEFTHNRLLRDMLFVMTQAIQPNPNVYLLVYPGYLDKVDLKQMRTKRAGQRRAIPHPSE